MNAPHFTTYAQVVQALGLEPRPQQISLVHNLGCVAIAPAGGHVIVQAGTGVGKSVATLSVAASVGRPGAPAVVLTVTNALTAQYTEKDAPAVSAATGMTFTRVIGAAHYICASSRAARMAGIPTADDLPCATDDPGDRAERAEAESAYREQREAWLSQQCDPRNGYATEFERTHHSDDYRCPGYPECDGALLGGCGKRKARARGFEVDVVITNFHCAAFQALYENARIIPLANAAMVLVDEAHAMPETIADILTTSIGPRFGRRSDVPSELLRYVSELREKLIRGVQWRAGYHRSERVLLSVGDAEELLARVEAAAGLHGATRSPDDDERIPALDTLRKWARLTLDPPEAVVPTCVVVYRHDDANHSRDTLYFETVEAVGLTRQILGNRAALVSGTVPRSLPRRCGLAHVIPTDVGHPFDYRASVRGWVSTVEGIKRPRKRESVALHEARTAQRIDELDAFIGDGSALVLTTAHDDVAMLTERLVPRLQLRGLHVYTQPRGGGSAAAREVAEIFRNHGPGAVLIGTDSLATGLDIPGDALRRVALWSLPLGEETPVDKVRRAAHPTYRDDRTRIKVAQSIGRLLRRTTDSGEVLLCDSRFGTDYLPGATGMIDAHLREISWQWLPVGPATRAGLSEVIA